MISISPVDKKKITHHQSANTQNFILKSQAINSFSPFDTIPFPKLNSEIFTNVVGSRFLFRYNYGLRIIMVPIKL